MNQNNHSFYLFGGGFQAGLKPWLEKQGAVTVGLTGISPLSRFAVCGDRLTAWLPELDAALAEAQAEYFVLDLLTAQRELLVSGGCYVSATARELSALKRGELAIVDPLLLPREQVERSLEELIGVIRKHFPPERVILIHTNQSPFWVESNNLRAELPPCGTPAQIQWLKALEGDFREKSGCHFVDVTRFYFYRKEVGRPLTDMIYEEECYRDVAGRILDITAGGDGRAERPDFALSLDRYVNYYFTIYRKPQRVFLDPDRLLDRLVLCASDNFVRAHRQELLELDLLDWHDPGRTLALLRQWGPEREIVKLCEAFYAISQGRYEEPGVDYALLFRSEIAPDMLITSLQKDYAPGAKLLPSQINRYNVGYHFAKMRGLDPGPYTVSETVAKPTTVDIFGSCISRTPFNVKDNDFAVNRYWFHIVPFEHRNTPVDYPPELFPEKLSWIDRLAKLQLDCSLYREIKESDAQWLVIDLYFLVGPYNYYYQNCLFGNFDRKTAKALNAQRVNLFQDPSLFGTADDLLAALDPWLKLIRKKYGKRIILLDGRLLGPWIGDDDRLHLRKVGSATTEFLRRAAAYVQSKIDCYRVDVGRYFLPDELGYMRNTPSHMETLGYRTTHDLIRHIVDEQPEQKVFDQYPGRTQMPRLRRLLRVNPPEALAAALPLSDLDKAVIRLSPEKLERWNGKLEDLYSQCDWSQTLEEILTGNSVEAGLAKDLREAAGSGLDAQPLPADYEAYPPESLIAHGGTVSGDLPDLPKVKLKRLANEKGCISLNWATSDPVPVRVYRQCGDAPWTLIGKSDDGQLQDTTIAPDTDYRYSLCVEAVSGGRRYLGRFTPPAAIHTAPDTPALISAVRLDGVNTLTWAPVPGAECYWIYRKQAADQKWVRCAVVSGSAGTCYREETGEDGAWYTVRALKTVSGKALASGFHSGLQAAPL